MAVVRVPCTLKTQWVSQRVCVGVEVSLCVPVSLCMWSMHTFRGILLTKLWNTKTNQTPESSFVRPNLNVSVFERCVWVLFPSRIHDYPDRGGLTKYRQTRGETWHGLCISNETVLICPLVRSYLQFCTPGRPFVCSEERRFWREQRGTSAVMLGQGPDKACYTRPSPTTTLPLSLSISLSVSLCVSLSFSLLVSYQKTINRDSQIEFFH